MSITSDRIRENDFIHVLADDAADDIEKLEAENAALRKEVEQLKSELASEKQDYLECEHMLHSERDTWQNKISELTRQRDLAVSAIENLVKQKGRHNTEIAYKKLVDVLAAIKESEV